MILKSVVTVPRRRKRLMVNDKNDPPLNTPLRPLRHFFWFFIMAIILPGMLTGLGVALWSAQQLIESQEKEARNLAAASAESMGNQLKNMLAAISVLSRLPLGKDDLAAFYRVAKDLSAIERYNVTLADGDGNQFLTTRLPLGAKLPQLKAMDSVRKAIASGSPHASEVFFDKLAGNYLITVDAPVSTRDGLRVITLSVDARDIAKTLSQIELPEDWLTGLIDEHGVFIARSKDQDQWIGKSTRPEMVDAASRFVSGNIYNKSVEGFPILDVFKRVPGTDWTVLIGIPVSVLYAPVMKPVGLLVGIILLATALTTLLVFVFYRQFSFATTRLLAIAHDPLRSDDRPAPRNAFAEFEVVAQVLKSNAGIQQRMMAKLGDSTERYYTLFNSIDEGFCLIEMIYDEHENPIDWRFLETNPAFEKQNGIYKATGKRIREFAPDLEPYWFKIYGEVARTGEPNRFQNEAKALGNRWFDLYAFRVGESGSHKVAVLFRDITENKKAERTAQKASQYARSLIEASLDPLVTISAEGKITDVNEASVQATGVPREQLIGTDFSDYFNDSAKAREGYQKVFSEGLVRDYPLAIRHVSGSIMDVLYNASVYKDGNGNVLGVFAAARDVTQQKLLNQQLQEKNTELEGSRIAADKANLAKSDFLSQMSHELRTPLNAILGFAQLLEVGAPSPTDAQMARLNQILKAGWYLLNLINEILDLALIESGKSSISLEPVSLSNVLLECQAMFVPQAEESSIHLHFHMFDSTWFVHADQTKLKQVLTNLLSNAIKYNSENGTVEVKCSVNTSGRLRISIKDTGSGLSAEQLAQLFQPFNRLGQETGIKEGTGIGLTVSKKLVEMMGGTIGVASTVGVGSEFWIELDQDDTSQFVAVVRLPEEFVSQPKGDMTGYTLLYVEDNLANLMLVEQIIEDRPHIRMLSVRISEHRDRSFR